MAMNFPVRGLEGEDIETLGDRVLDQVDDWSAHIGKYPDPLELGELSKLSTIPGTG